MKSGKLLLLTILILPSVSASCFVGSFFFNDSLTFLVLIEVRKFCGTYKSVILLITYSEIYDVDMYSPGHKHAYFESSIYG